MSELNRTHNGRNGLRRQLLGSGSLVAIVAMCAASIARANDTEHPTVWIELGGQLEHADGTEGRFVVPFLQTTPTPLAFATVSPIEAQRPPRWAIGGEGKLSLAPTGTRWVLSAAVRYGRSNGGEHVHYQSYVYHRPQLVKGLTAPQTGSDIENFADTAPHYSESHFVLDFQAGKDVGLGIFGRDSSSVFDVGVRFAQFVSHADVNISARPNLQFYDGTPVPRPTKYKPVAKFDLYQLAGHSQRSFHGLGPTLSWNASVPLAGNADTSEFNFDWGINGAILFGRQKSRVQQSVTAYHVGFRVGYTTLYKHTPPTEVRRRSIVVPNIGGFAGLSANFPNAKVSFGYRADFFFGAMDTGIEAANRTNTSFRGPYATVSVGLGG